MLSAVVCALYFRKEAEAALLAEARQLAGGDPDLWVIFRIYGEALSASLHMALYGGLCATLLASGAAITFAARAVAHAGTTALRAAPVAAIFVGLASLVAISAEQRALPFCALLVGIIPTLTGVLAAAAASLAHRPEKEGAEKPLADLLLCVVAAVSGVGFASIAVRAAVLLDGLSHRTTITPDVPFAWVRAAHASFAHGSFAMPVVLAALAPAVVFRRYVFTALAEVRSSLLGFVALSGVTVGLAQAELHNLGRFFAHALDYYVPADVVLPTVSKRMGSQAPTAGIVLVGSEWLTEVWGGPSLSRYHVEALESGAGCREITEQLRRRFMLPGTEPPALGVDAAAPYAHLACLLPLARGSSGVDLLVDVPKQEGTLLRPPFDQTRPYPEVLKVDYVDAIPSNVPGFHVHLTPTGASVQSEPASTKHAKSGSGRVLLQWLGPQLANASRLLVTAEPRTPAGLVIEVASLPGSGALVTLGPPSVVERENSDSRQ
jgi:hypothetical protein